MPGKDGTGPAAGKGRRKKVSCLRKLSKRMSGRRKKDRKQ